MHDIWNPWHGCVKYSDGCRNCYMYALDRRRGVERPSDEIYATKQLRYPLAKDRKGNYKIKPGERIRVNMTSDTFLDEADQWRDIMWDCIRQRPDVGFWLLTKRVPRIQECLPDDWGTGCPNVMLNMTAENQKCFEERWPIFAQVPAQAKGICCAPLLSPIDLEPALSSGQICEVSAGGENYDNPRPCHYEWYESLSLQCKKHNVPFYWYESGTKLVKSGKLYFITKKSDQAKIAGLSGLNAPGPRPNLILRSLDDGHILSPSECHVPMYNPVHCAGCGNAGMCNGCDPKCRQRDASYRMVTWDELKALEQAQLQIQLQSRGTGQKDEQKGPGT